jgi:hypothetical protein
VSSVVGLLVFAATALALTNTVNYTVTLKGSKGTIKKPANLGYNAVLHIDTDPPGQQPNTAPVTSIYFPKQIKYNSKILPSCSLASVDGKDSMPPACKKAKVGTGTAHALAGSPGQDGASAINEDLDVTFLNGGAKQILLVLNSTPTAPVKITNRVVPGDLTSSDDSNFGYRVDFKIPQDLQEPVPGVKVALVDFKVQISPKSIKPKKKGGKPVSYLQLTGCPGGSLPNKAVAHFIDENGQPAGDVESPSVTKC